MKLIIIAVVLFIMISEIRMEDQEAISKGLIANVTETKSITSDTDLHQYFDNITTLSTNETSTTKSNQIVQHYLEEERDERDVKNEEEEKDVEEGEEEEQIEEQKKLESEEEEEQEEEAKNDEKLEQQQRRAENEDDVKEYIDESSETMLRLRREQLQMEHLSHQANLFRQLNLNHNFEDWSVNLDEEMEDMINVLSHDEDFPFRDVNPTHTKQDSSKNTSEDDKKSEWLYNEYNNYFEPPFDSFYDSS